MTVKASKWDCNEQGHFWNSQLMQKSRVVDCDWCIVCTIVRPGFKDPRKKKL